MHLPNMVALVIPTVAGVTFFALQLLLSCPPHALSASLNLPSGPHVHLVMYSGLWPIDSPQAEKARAPQAGVN